MTINLQHDAFDQGKADVRQGAMRLRDDRDDIDLQVSGFLRDGWTGIAAESFVDAWDEWKLAATDVLEGLESMGALLHAAQADFVAQDEDSQRRLDQISARIIERLG